MKKNTLLLLAAASALAETPFGLIDETTPLYTAADVDAATTNLSARPVALAPGQTDIDAHGDAHNGPVALGEGAAAAVDTTGLSTTIRSVSVAIGAGADARDLKNPAKQQAIAIGNQSRASAVNSIAIGSGVRHGDENYPTGRHAHTAAAPAPALGLPAPTPPLPPSPPPPSAPAPATTTKPTLPAATPTPPRPRPSPSATAPKP